MTADGDLLAALTLALGAGDRLDRRGAGTNLPRMN
jgi:hypothetical protein